MIETTRTVKLTGQAQQEYEQIVAHMADLHDKHPEWTIIHNPDALTVVATRVEQVVAL